MTSKAEQNNLDQDIKHLLIDDNHKEKPFGRDSPQQPNGHNEATDIVAQLLFDLGANDTHRHSVHNMLTVGSIDRPRIEEYIRDSHAPSHEYYTIELIECYEIRNPRDNAFKQHIGDSRLLFHGTEKQNVYAILRDGFRWRIGSEKGRFGRGVYFSDCVSKAANYTSNDPRRFLCNNGHTRAEIGDTKPDCSQINYLFLAEVAIGESRDYAFNPKTHDSSKVLRGADSVKAVGLYTYRNRDWESYHFKGLDFEASIPVGELKKRNHGVEMIYDEFVIYNSAQVRHRWLLQCRFVPCDKTKRQGVSALSDAQVEMFSRPHDSNGASETNDTHSRSPTRNDDANATDR